MSEPHRHPVATTPRGIRERQLRENQTELLLPPLKKNCAQRAAQRQNCCMPLFGIEECIQVELKKANQQMCLQQSARSKAEQPKSELSCCAERPSGAPRASAAIRRTRCLPLSCATTRIWHDNAPQERIRKVSCEAHVLVKTKDMRLSRAANQQPAARNSQAFTCKWPRPQKGSCTDQPEREAPRESHRNDRRRTEEPRTCWLGSYITEHVYLFERDPSSPV